MKMPPNITVKVAPSGRWTLRDKAPRSALYLQRWASETMRACLLLITLQTLSACSMVKVTDMEESLNTQVGKRAVEIIAHPEHLTYRDIDGEKYELTWLRPDACSYALVVRKSDNVIVGWHFLQTPAPTGCKFQSVRQLM